MATTAQTGTRRWRGMEPAERDEQRRRRLLDAALEMFGTAGYAASPIEALCANANVATRSFYELFGSREALLTAVYDEIIEAIAGDMSIALADDGPDTTQLVRRAVASYLVPLVSDERKGRVTQLEAVGVSSAFEMHRRGAIRTFAALIDEQIERWEASGRIPARPDPPALLTLVLAGGVSEALVDHLVTPKPRRRSLDALIDEITRIWLLAFGVADGSL